MSEEERDRWREREREGGGEKQVNVIRDLLLQC